MFKAKTKNISVLRDSLESISTLIAEGTFKINSNGMGLVAMDPASVAMIVYNLWASSFEEFTVKDEVIISFNIQQLVSFLKRAGSKDEVNLSTDGSKFKIKIIGKESEKEFTLPLIDLRLSEQKVPDLEFTTTVEVDSSLLKDSVKDAMMISDFIKFETDSGKCVVSTSGEGTEMKTEFKGADGEASAKYSVDYLDKMLGLAKLTDKVKLKFSSDYPLRFEFLDKDRFQIVFILAPRVDND